MMETTEMTLSTGELADEADVNLQTVLYYERRGLLPPPPRTAAGYRQFDGEYVARIRFIKRAQELGFSLEEIEELLALRTEPDADRTEIRRRTEEKIGEIQRKIDDLSSMKETLEELVRSCVGHGPVSDCPILEAIAHDEEDA